MGDRRASRHEQAKEGIARHRLADSLDAQAKAEKSDILSGHELAEAARKANATHIQAIKDSGILEILLPALEVQKQPGGYIALFRIEDIGGAAVAPHSAKSFTALEAINAGKPCMNVRLGRRYMFANPDKLIIALENNGFALSGQLQIHRDEILEDAKKRGQGHQQH